MKEYLKNSLKVLVGYSASLLIFVIFLPMVLNFISEGSRFWLVVYSFFTFLIMYAMVYGDMKRLAEKEKRPQYNLKPYPVKGLLLGFLGFSPFILIEIIYPFLSFDNEIANRIKELVLKTLFGPMYGVIKLIGGGTAAYIIAAVLVPLIAMLGYLAGYYGFELGIFSKLYVKKPNNDKNKPGTGNTKR